MDCNTVTLETLSQCFLATLSPLPEPRRHAESTIATAADQPGFSLAVIRLISAPSAIDDQIRHAAAVNFKNHIRSRWSPSNPPTRDGIPPHSPIPDQEKEQIKNLIVKCMLSAPLRVQSQLSEALSVISSYDFPKLWPNLLPELVCAIKSATDYTVINGLLGAVNSIFKKFRFTYGTTDIRLDLKYCLDNFAAPLLEVFLRTAGDIVNAVSSGGGSPEILRRMFESQRLCCRIFLSLNSVELPEFFEDHMREWMTEFRIYLTTMYPAVIETDGTADNLRAAVCENLQLYMNKNEEEFKDYLSDFTSAVWTLLMTPSTSGSRDRLTITAIKFLTTISTSVHHSLFASPEALQQICHSIVFPNIRAQDEDEEMFEMNYIEYIRRDIEGSDMETRRRIVCELLKGIAVNYREQVMAIVVAHVQTMLSSYLSKPVENWKDKDCAIYLVVSLSTKKASGQMEAAHLIDVVNFFASAIVPELQSHDVNAAPMLKAGALKFFTVFQSQILKQNSVLFISDVIRFLGSESNVVHSYAANCIEKLLILKDNGLPRFSSSDITPFVQSLITNLFKVFQFPESQENHYVMKCVMRLLSVVDISDEVVSPCIGHLSMMLSEVCKNPKNPVFNHYLFEAIAALIGKSCEKNPTLITVFESNLFPVLQSILVNDITEFWPYAFQLFAQLVEISRPPLAQNYMQLFELLLSPDSWKRNANVPALARLLQAYLKKVPNELNSQGRLTQVLGIFNKLISQSSTEELGFYVLNTVVENLNYDVILPYIQNIWNVLFTRLQNQRTVRFIKSLLIFMSLVLVKHGHLVLVDSVNVVQANLFRVILEQVWIPNLQSITGFVEMKLAAVASTKLMCESSSLLDDSAVQVWISMLENIVSLLVKPEQDRVFEDTDVPDISENTGYTPSFVRLRNAGKKEEDPLKEIKDPKEFLVSSLASLSANTPGKWSSVIKIHLNANNKAALHEFCSTYNRSIV